MTKNTTISTPKQRSENRGTILFYHLIKDYFKLERGELQ